MRMFRAIAALLVLSLICALAYGQRRKKKKGQDEEEVTQTLPLLKDPPAATLAETGRLSFRVSPLSGKGLLSPQVRDALKGLIQGHRGAGIVKLRAFVAGTGDVRRVQTLVSEVFTDKRLPIPALTVVLTGGLPLEGAQVVIESTAAEKRTVNPHGLAFLAGRPGESASKSIGALSVSLGELGLEGSRVLRATCFLSSLENAAGARSALAGAFPNAALNVVQMQRVPVRPPCECEAVAALNRSVEGEVQWRPGTTLVSAPHLVITGLQMAFNSEPSDVRLALDRLGRTLESQGASYGDAVSGSVYLLSGEAGSAFEKLRMQFFRKEHPPALTMLPFEGLPSVDASLGMDLLAIAHR